MQPSKGITQGLRAIVSNIGWLSADRILRMGGSLLVGALVARYLEPAAFGLLNLAIAIYMVFNTVSNLGLDYLVVRDIVLHPDLNHEVLGTAFWLKGAASVVTTLFAILFTWSTHPGQKSLVIMVALLSGAAISQALDVIDYFFQAKTLSRYTVVPKLAAWLLVNLLRLWAVYKKAPIMVFVELAAAEIVLGELALLVSYKLYAHGLPRWKLRAIRGQKLLRESWPIVLASLLIMIYMRTDQILIGYMKGERFVGYYSAAVRLSEIWYAIPVLICNSAMPRLLQTLAQDKQLYYKRVQVMYNWLVLLNVLLALLTMLLSTKAVTLLFGQAYLPAAHVLNIHIWTGIFVVLGVLGGQQLVHEGLVVIELQRTFLGAVINLALNILLIPRYGITGSALATLAAQAAAAYFSDAFSARTRHLFRMKTYALSGAWLFRGGLRWS